ncbi:MAG: L-serine ammonia-lyase, iron-sulfur-dependent, subunit alpha [Eubacteriales bacterium]|nr:L-serine ammonia-lyase, iron-sulfur-dependent, subunit alpha [Eubacteriales bacterium]
MWEVILAHDCNEQDVSREESLAKMTTLWQAMRSASRGYRGDDMSASGLVGGDGERMRQRIPDSLCGPFVAEVIAEALKMGECNACMKRIVAAPTAGSCGVLPAVLLPYARHRHVADEKMLPALYVAAAVGQVIARRAFIAGAEGGCQAEVGAASAMAAAALVCLQGGSNQAVAHACAMALKNLLGLVCDPVAGLVEIPCVKRNVVGAVNALSSAEMALAGITSRIPADEVIDALREVGQALPSSLRETAQGGLAATPTGRRLARQLHGSLPD